LEKDVCGGREDFYADTTLLGALFRRENRRKGITPMPNTKAQMQYAVKGLRGPVPLRYDESGFSLR
jgi:hypothetical protein